MQRELGASLSLSSTIVLPYTLALRVTGFALKWNVISIFGYMSRELGASFDLSSTIVLLYTLELRVMGFTLK